MSVTDQLKAELWKRFGTPAFPSEWDGHVYGGGKLSQRYWEYFKALELLQLNPDAVVLDIGGGSPITGVGFFSQLLSCAVKKVIVFDPNISQSVVAPESVEFVRKEASYCELKNFLEKSPFITHISCVSVFEHIDSATREGIIRAINDFFKGSHFVATFEFHSKRSFFEFQVTSKTVSSLFIPFENFYLDEYLSSPVACENSFESINILKLFKRKLV